MVTLLLDTTVIVDAINGKKRREQFLADLIDQRYVLACCPINVTEVFAGMRPHEAKATEEFLRSLKFYEVPWETARFAGELKNTWAKKGKTLSLPDVTVAAVALTRHLPLLTDNHKHFPMAELQLVPLP